MTSETIAASTWDSEKRNSPYSTVSDPGDESYCEECDSEIDYSDPTHKHGKCNCA